MPQATATILVGLVVVVTNLLTAAFVYGRLTERVRSLDIQVETLGDRVESVEKEVSGRGGHAERITRLEYPRSRD